MANCQLASAHSSVRVKVYPLSWYCRLPPSTDLGHVWAWMKLSSLIGTVLQYANAVFLITNACRLQKDFVAVDKLNNCISEAVQLSAGNISNIISNKSEAIWDFCGERSQSAATWVTQRLNLLVKMQLCSFTSQLFAELHLSWALVYKQWHFPPAFQGSLETLICYASVAEQQVQPPMILHDMKWGALLSCTSRCYSN